MRETREGRRKRERTAQNPQHDRTHTGESGQKKKEKHTNTKGAKKDATERGKSLRGEVGKRQRKAKENRRGRET